MKETKYYRGNSLRIAYGITMLVLLLTGSASALYDSEAQSFLGLINNYRTQNNLGKLIVDVKLQESANWMSNDMLSNCVTGKYTCSHTDSTGRTFVQRLKDFGYPAGVSASAAENIAWGSGGGASSAQQAFDLWKNSQGHRINMLGSSFVAISISRSCSAGDCAWVTDFGSMIVKPLNNDTIPGPTPTPPRQIAGINVDDPNGGEVWPRGTTHDVKWSYKGNPGPNVKIELWKGGKYHHTITSSTPNDGSYTWRIPSDQEKGNNYKVKIQSKTRPIYSDMSDKYYTIS